MEPLISVVTISYNCENEIEETITSVIKQSYKKLQYILVDGGSSDGTMAVVEKYREHFFVVISEKDKGISDAFNKGIASATGDLIVMINAGDLLTEGALQVVADNYSPDIGVYKGDMIYRNKQKNMSYYVKTKEVFTNPPWNNKVGHQACYISPEVYKKTGLYKIDYKYYMDMDLMIRFAKSNINYKYINEALAIYSVGGISFGNVFIRLPEAYKMVRENDGNFFQAFIFVIYLMIRRACKNTIQFLVKNGIEKFYYGYRDEKRTID